VTVATEVPFACRYDDGSASLETLNGKRVTQCALSRICGVCGTPLGRPIAFVGTPEEIGRNAFHFPPLHLGCANDLLPVANRSEVGVLGRDEATTTWSLVTTAGFEFVRAGRGDLDKRPTFEPNSLLA